MKIYGINNLYIFSRVQKVKFRTKNHLIVCSAWFNDILELVNQLQSFKEFYDAKKRRYSQLFSITPVVMGLTSPVKVWLIILLNIINSRKIVAENILDGGYLKTCPRPLAPLTAVISFLVAPRFYLGQENGGNGGYGVTEYQEHDKVYFQCRDGYTQSDQSIMYISCGSDGKWFPEPEKATHCIPDKNFYKCSSELFQCVSSKKCLSVFKKCDCVNDCEDGSDEVDCDVRRRYIATTSQGRDSGGIITSPGYPRFYPKYFSCLYVIYTLKDHHIQLDFEEFQLPEKVDDRCIDHVSLVGIHPWYLSKDNKNYKRINKKDQKLEDFRETKCGTAKFRRVYSNLTHLTINVSLGYLGSDTNYRGYSLSWKVRSKKYFNELLTSEKFDEKKDLTIKNESDANEGFYTVLTPIAISALLPLSLVTFLCCHRRLRGRHSDVQKKEKRTATDDDDGDDDDDDDDDDNNVEEQKSEPMTLTQNNLAQFEYQMRYKDITRNLIRSSDHVLPPGKTSLIEHQYPTTYNATMDTAEQAIDTCEDATKRNSYSSAQSETNRYIMSYDLPFRDSPITTQWHEITNSPSNSLVTRISSNSPHQLHSHRSNSPRQIHSQHTNSPHGVHSRCPRNISKSQNIRSSYSSHSG